MHLGKVLLFFFAFSALTGCDQSFLRQLNLGPGDDSLLASAADANDCGFIQNSFGQRISWKTNIPVTLNIHSNFPETYREVIRTAANHWNEAAGLTLFNFQESQNSAEGLPKKDGSNTISYLTEWNKSEFIQGLTALYWSKDRLIEADMSINAQHFEYFIAPVSSNDTALHLESLVIHELGHILGLKHNKNPPTVMYDYLSGGVLRNTLSPTDKSSVKCEY